MEKKEQTEKADKRKNIPIPQTPLLSTMGLPNRITFAILTMTYLKVVKDLARRPAFLLSDRSLRKDSKHLV